MSGRPPRQCLGSGALPDRLFQAFSGLPCWPSCTGGNRPRFPPRTTQPCCTASCPSHYLPRPLGHRADRMALYKVIRHRGTARTVRGARSERDARLGRLRCSGLSYSMSTGRETPCPCSHTLVELKSPRRTQLVSAGAARFTDGRWRLPIFLFPVKRRRRAGPANFRGPPTSEGRRLGAATKLNESVLGRALG
jgi:hypothetical protein